MLSQDEVWIDTSELREKKRKRHVRPISKLLNPFARGGGYSTAVALNFTQTKLEMPATKQSTISSFFNPQRRGSEKKPASSAGHYGDASIRAPKSQETKPLKDFGCQTSFNHSALNHSDLFNMAENNICCEELAHECEKPNSTSTFNSSKEQTFLHLITGYESEEDVEEPEEKRGAYEPFFMPGSHLDKQPPGHQPSEGKDSISGLSELSEREFRARMQHADCTSTQTKVYSSSSAMHSPAKLAGKENSPSGKVRLRDSGYSGSPLKSSRSLTPSSPAAKSRPWENKSQSPLKPFLNAVPPLSRKLDLEVDCRAAKPRPWETKSQSPLRPFFEASPLPSRQLDLDADSMAALFTQDSQGFRVIAHRPLQQQSCSALRDRTNTGGGSSRGGGEGSWRVPSIGALHEAESEQEAEMLFTQDSQGNLVIKH